MGGTECDGRLEIAAHSHGQTVEPVARGQLFQEGEMQRWFLVHGRDAHQACDRQIQRAALADEPVSFGGQYTGQLRHLPRVDQY